MKRALVLGAGLFIASAGMNSARADLPVVDIPAMGEWALSLAATAKAYALQVEQYATEVKTYVGDELSWVKQASQYATQLQQYAQEIQLFMNFYHYPSFSGGLSLALRTTGLGSSLPVNPYAALSLVNGLEYGVGSFSQISGILGSLSGMANTAFSTNHIYTPTDASWNSQQMIARANGIAGAQGASMAAIGDLKLHQASLQPLRDQLAASQSSKDVADAQAQISLEGVYASNEAAQLQAVHAAYEAQSDSQSQRDNEKLDQDIEGFLASSPVSGP